jgi:NAD+ diphosphatase
LDTAFFFQGDSCLLPIDIPDSGFDAEIPLRRLSEFDIPAEGAFLDRFEIPDLNTAEPGTHAGAFIRGLCIPPGVSLPTSWRAVQVRQALSLLCDSPAGGSAGTATDRLLREFHIAQWRQDSQYCGACGTKNADCSSELARLCPVCGRLEYPRIAPAIIVIVFNDEGQVLLAHNKKFRPGMYSLIAGFNEAGESLEATVRRELREEVNIEVSDIRYAVSQPWPFPNSLMVGFSAHYAGGILKADGLEIEDARWWSREALPELPGSGSLSRHLIDRWLAGEQ